MYCPTLVVRPVWWAVLVLNYESYFRCPPAKFPSSSHALYFGRPPRTSKPATTNKSPATAFPSPHSPVSHRAACPLTNHHDCSLIVVKTEHTKSTSRTDIHRNRTEISIKIRNE